MVTRGWVYVITNKAMTDLVKVGFSTKDPVLRAREFDATGVPHRYEVVFDVLVSNPREVEQRAHRRLADCLEAKEWFRCSVKRAIEEIRASAGDILQETTHRSGLESWLKPDLSKPQSSTAQANPSFIPRFFGRRDSDFFLRETLGVVPLGRCSNASCDDWAKTTFAGKPLCAQHGAVARDNHRWGRR